MRGARKVLTYFVAGALALGTVREMASPAKAAGAFGKMQPKTEEPDTSAAKRIEKAKKLGQDAESRVFTLIRSLQEINDAL